jgi:hypothetical protein
MARGNLTLEEAHNNEKIEVIFFHYRMSTFKTRVRLIVRTPFVASSRSIEQLIR